MLRKIVDGLSTTIGLLILPVLLLCSLRRSSLVAQWLRDLTSTRRAMIAMARVGYGSGERYWIVGIVVLTLLWLIGGTLAIWASPEMQKLRADYNANVAAEVVYRLVGLLGGSDEYLQEVGNAQPGEERLKLSPALSWARWPALLLPFWIALPPLFAWLSRRGEPLAVRQLLSGHYLIIGYGQVGSALARDLLQQKAEDRSVVIVEIAGGGSELRGASRAGAIVIEEDAHQSAINYAAEDFVEDLAAHRAAGILVATGSASRNIDIAGRLARDIAQIRKRDPIARVVPMPRLVPHINDRRLMVWVTSKAGKSWLRGPEQERSLGLRPEIVPFSADQTAVRQLLSERPIATYAELRGVRRPHLVVLGHDTVAEWLIPQAVQAARVQNMEAPRLTWIVGQSAGSEEKGEHDGHHTVDRAFAKQAEVLRDYLEIDVMLESFDFSHIDSFLFDLAHPLPPGLNQVADELSGQKQPTNRAFDRQTLDEWMQEGDPVTSIFICFGSDEQNLEVALHLQDLINRERRWLAPTFVRLYRDSGLEDVLSRSEYQDKVSLVIDDFGQDAEVCTREEIFDEARDQAARRAHQIYEMGASIGRLVETVPETADAAGWRRWRQRVDEAIRAVNNRQAREDLRGLRRMLSEEPVDTERVIRRWLSRPPPENPYNCLAAGSEDVVIRGMVARKQAIDAFCSGEGDKPNANNHRTKTGDDPWRNLDHEYIVSNRDQVDHLPAKLRGLGYRGITLRPDDAGPPDSLLRGPWPLRTPWEGHAASFLLGRGSLQVDLPKSLERTAKVEHERYMIERLIGGWRYGPGRDNIRRLHPSLLPYDTLRKQTEEKLKDQRSVIDVEMLLASLRPLRQWRPECRVGIIGPLELSPTERRALKRAARTALEAILSLEYQRLEQDMKPLTATDGCRDLSGPSEALERARSSLALCLISDDGQWPPAEQEGNRGSVRLVQKSMRDWARQGAMPFRTIAARLTPEQRAVKGSPTSVVHQEDDHWEVDLLPEGIPLSAVDHNTDLTWRPGVETAEWSEEPIAPEEQQKIFDMRSGAWSEWFAPLADAYVDNQSDWLMRVDRGKISSSLERTSQRDAPELEGLMPAGDGWVSNGREVSMSSPASDEKTSYRVRIDCKKRIVSVLLGGCP